MDGEMDGEMDGQSNTCLDDSQSLPSFDTTDDGLFPGATELIDEGLNINKGQLAAIIVAFYFRHNISKSALQDLLLFNVIISNCTPPTKYLIEKYLFVKKLQLKHICTVVNVPIILATMSAVSQLVRIVILRVTLVS